jgi:hypothetical protein
VSSERARAVAWVAPFPETKAKGANITFALTHVAVVFTVGKGMSLNQKPRRPFITLGTDQFQNGGQG